MTLAWYTFQDPLLDDVRRLLWTKILDLVGWEGTAVLTAAQILHMLEIRGSVGTRREFAVARELRIPDGFPPTRTGHHFMDIARAYLWQPLARCNAWIGAGG